MPDLIPAIGSPVAYVLPNGETRTAFVLGEVDGALTLSVHKHSAGDFKLPPNQLGPEILAGHGAESATATVAGVRCGKGPGAWNVLPGNAVPSATPAAPNEPAQE